MPRNSLLSLPQLRLKGINLDYPISLHVTAASNFVSTTNNYSDRNLAQPLLLMNMLARMHEWRKNDHYFQRELRFKNLQI